MIQFHHGLVKKEHAPFAHGLLHKSVIHPAGRITAIDEKSGLPIVRRDAAHSPVIPPEAPPSPIGQEEPKTGRDILHASNDPEVIQKAATDSHPDIKADLKAAIKNIDGATLHGARDEKHPDRLEEKIEDEGQNPRTIPDYSGFRVAVDTRKAKDEVVAAIRKAFTVVREKDEFEKGAEDTAFHAHMMQVQDAGDPVTHEVQVLPKTVADNAEATHGLYEKARTGDKDAAAKMKGKNKVAWKAFANAQGKDCAACESGDCESHCSVKSDDVGTSSKPKYKFGNTQANIPEGSEAHAALMTAGKKIDPSDLNPTSYGGDGSGAEPDPHVTVRYGVRGDDTSNLEKFICSQSPFHATLGKTSSFPPSESSDGGAVIKADVHSPDLHRINAEIEKHGDFEPSNFPQYVPHATVAYVKPETARKYVGMSETDGKKFHVKSIALTDRNGNAKEIPLEGGKSQQLEGGRGESPEQPAAVGDKSPAAQVKTGMTVKLPDGRTGTVKGISPKGELAVKLASGGRVSIMKTQVKVIDPNIEVKGVTSGTPGHDRPIVGAIAVDMDKTMAHYSGYKGPTIIGKPIAAQVNQVKQMLKDGKDVWIYTARVEHPEAIPALKGWAKENIGQELPVTNIKYPEFHKFIDDRAELPVQMQKG